MGESRGYERGFLRGERRGDFLVQPTWCVSGGKSPIFHHFPPGRRSLPFSLLLNGAPQSDISHSKWVIPSAKLARINMRVRVCARTHINIVLPRQLRYIEKNVPLSRIIAGFWGVTATSIQRLQLRYTF